MPDEYRGAPEWSQPPGPRKTSGTAVLALGAGVASFLCLPGLGGVLAIALGWVAHSEIERSNGRLTGKGVASTGIGFGIANLVVAVVGVGVLVALAVRADPAPVAVAPAPPAPPSLPAPARPRRSRPPAVVPAPIPAPPPTPAPAEVADSEPSLPVLAPRVGKIEVVEMTPGSTDLEQQLLKQLTEAKAAGQQVMLWTVTADCEPCDDVGRALPDARLQRALGNVRLVRANAASFPMELRRLGVPIDTVPGFTLLDSHARALDHIHGGEWDADIPANIAPILDKFVKRSLVSRRHPWSRPLRDGETTL